MMVYAACLFLAAAVFFGVAAAIYRGHTDLIHSCHRAHVGEAERRDYGRSFSRGLFVLAASQALSAAAALLGETALAVAVSVGILFVGMAVSFIIIAGVQKKYNGGFW
ncbi:MAG: hypothetical protein HFF60_01520 [Oscillospiraceae bacterium]|nr:hypothetical protein [Oscillospiraceae bacterium]